MTNEQKCFCGAEIAKHYNLKQELVMLSCKNPDCFMNSDLHPEMFRERQHQIKSVIEKEYLRGYGNGYNDCWRKLKQEPKND